MTYELITRHNSPNYLLRSAYGNNSGAITGITIHHWGERGQNFDNVVNFLCRANGNTSAHVVCEAGRVAWIIDAAYAAWHSGSTQGNGWTIGIELRPEATAGDYATAAELIRDIRAEYGDIPLIPHRQWFNTACPGVWDLGKLDRMARSTPSASVAPTPKIGFLTMLSDAEQTELLTKVRDLHRDYSQGIIGRQSDGDSFGLIRSIAHKLGVGVDEQGRKKRLNP